MNFLYLPDVAVGFSVYTVKADDPDANKVLNYFFRDFEAITPGGVKVDPNVYDFRVRCIWNQYWYVL